MTSIYRPQMGRRGPLTSPSSPLVPQGTQQPAPYKPAPVAPGINFNPPQQPAAPMLPGQQQPQQAQQTQQYTGDVFAKPAVMPQEDTPEYQQRMQKMDPIFQNMSQAERMRAALDDSGMGRGGYQGMSQDERIRLQQYGMPSTQNISSIYTPDRYQQQQPGMLPPGIQPPTNDLAEIMGKYKAKQTPLPEIPPYNPPLEPPGMGRGYPEMPGMGGRGMGRQKMMMQQQQMMRQIQMLQQMMQQQMMQRQMRRGNRQQPMVGFGPNISNFQGPDVSGTMEEMPMVMYKKGGTVKEKKMAMGGMGGPMDRMGLAPQPRQMPMPPRMAAANRAEAMGLLKGAIGAPGGTAGGTMQNALAALKGMKKGGKVEDSEMVGKEVAFMKKKGAPKSMIKHEQAEMKGFARGGGIESKGKTKGKIVKMASGGMVGHASSRADGCAQRGKTRCKQVKMAGGGSC